VTPLSPSGIYTTIKAMSTPKKLNVLIVTKDLMPFRMAHPIAEELRRLGHIVLISASGSSLPAWNAIDFPFGMIEGDDPNVIIDKANPDIVVVGLSSPIDTEDFIAKIANERNIPVVALSDTWGASSRMVNGTPNTMITMDDIDQGIASMRFPDARVVSVGDWTTSQLLVSPQDIWGAGHKRTMFIAGQNPATIGDFVTESLRMIHGLEAGWIIAFRPHPKYLRAPEIIEANLLLTKSGVALLDNTSATGDELAATADVTVSGFSGVLRTAALHGKMAVSVDTDPCLVQMLKSTKLRTYPLVDIGACSKSSAIDKLVWSGDFIPFTGQVNYRESICPANLNLAVSTIIGLGEK
jgi:hypothetical protein